MVVGLARGGVAVAAEVAAALDLPLDALAVRKVGHPLQPEYALGAVTPGGGVYVRSADGLTPQQIEAVVAAALARADELDRRQHAHSPALDVAGRAWARAPGAGRVVGGVRGGAPETGAGLRGDADSVVCPEQPAGFGAVGLWYREFAAVEDGEVIALLDRAARREPGTGI